MFLDFIFSTHSLNLKSNVEFSTNARKLESEIHYFCRLGSHPTRDSNRRYSDPSLLRDSREIDWFKHLLVDTISIEITFNNNRVKLVRDTKKQKKKIVKKIFNVIRSLMALERFSTA